MSEETLNLQFNNDHNNNYLNNRGRLVTGIYPQIPGEMYSNTFRKAVSMPAYLTLITLLEHWNNLVHSIRLINLFFAENHRGFFVCLVLVWFGLVWAPFRRLQTFLFSSENISKHISLAKHSDLSIYLHADLLLPEV